MIKIVSAEDAAKEIRDNPNYWNVISIRDVKHSGMTLKEHPMERLMDRAISGIILDFDDVWDEKHERLYGYVMPKKADIEEGLDFAKDKDPLLIHCWHGVSRSTAMAYVIACSRMPATEAINIFESHHCPNPLVVELGAEILDNKEMLDIFKEYEKRERINDISTKLRIITL
jgi:predicted protein tyrosine phosphatase